MHYVKKNTNVSCDLHACVDLRAVWQFATVLLAAGLILAFLLSVAPAFASVGPPEVERFLLPVVHQTAIAPEGGVIGAKMLETHWHFEYSTTRRTLEEGTFEKGNGTPIGGCSGTITQAAAEASEHQVVECTGEAIELTAETTYYIRLLAKNSAGEGSLVESVTTGPRHPVINSSPSTSDSTAASVHVEGSVIPNNFETHWRFEYAIDPKMLEEGHGSAGPEGVILKTEADENFHKVEGDLNGLKESTAYYVRLHADNGNVPPATSAATSFETAGAPVAVTFAAHGIDGESMRALGSVKPHGYVTHYYIEYVTQGNFEVSGWGEAGRTAVVDAGSGGYTNGAFPILLVGVDLPGLEAGVTYRYRLVASSTAPGNPVVDGHEQALKVPVAGKREGGVEETPSTQCPNGALRLGPSAALPDCRTYEQVTPAEKGGAQDVFKYGAVGEGALVGEDGEHFMLHAPGVEWGSSPDTKIANYFFTRTPGGWQMTSPRPKGEAGPKNYLPFLFSSNLTQDGLEVGWETSAASFSENIELEAGPPGGPYVRVASLPRAEIEREKAWVAASADFSKIVFETKDHKLLGHTTGTTSGEDLYEFSGGEVRQVNVGIGTCGARMVKGLEDYEDKFQPESQSNARAVSANGARVFFEAVPGNDCAGSSHPHLYVRVNGIETVDIGEYVFLAANPDGSQLLLEKETSETHKFLLYKTEGATTKPLFFTKQAIFQRSTGEAAVVSVDLSTIYFFSTEQLTADAPPPTAATSSAAKNIYRYDIANDKLRFVAQSGGNLGAHFEAHSTSRDGRYFYWITRVVAGIPGGAEESDQVYRYDSGEDVVQCMSCASPFDPQPKLSATFSETGTSHPNDGVPNLTDASSNGNYVFFDTPAALVPEDVDGEVPQEDVRGEHPSVAYSVSSDVYEWRKDGVNGCVHVQGCVALISSGTGGYKNELLGTTESGKDVFFATHESLVGGDRDTAGDVYDARVGGGFASPPVGPVECEGDACARPLAAPIDSTPASVTFSGAGNVTPPVAGTSPKTKQRCGKGMLHRRGRCVRSKRGKRARSHGRAGTPGKHGHGSRK